MLCIGYNTVSDADTVDVVLVARKLRQKCQLVLSTAEAGSPFSIVLIY